MNILNNCVHPVLHQYQIVQTLKWKWIIARRKKETTNNRTEDIPGPWGPLFSGFVWCTTECENEGKQDKNTRCGLGRATDKSEGIKWERKQLGELHGSNICPPDVCLQLSGGCWPWRSACSGSHRVQMCCLGGTLGISETDRFSLNFSPFCPESISRIYDCGLLTVLLRSAVWNEIQHGCKPVRKWVYNRKEVAVPQSHIPICNDNQAERKSAL